MGGPLIAVIPWWPTAPARADHGTVRRPGPAHAPERWDGDNQLQLRCVGYVRGLTAPGTGAISYGYDANGQPTRPRYPDGTRLSYTYWPDGRLAAYPIALSAQTLAGWRSARPTPLQ